MSESNVLAAVLPRANGRRLATVTGSPIAQRLAYDGDVAQLRVCDDCRRRKTKCDMQQPSCFQCRTRGQSCAYSMHRRKPGPSKGTVRVRKTSAEPRSRPMGHFQQTEPSCVLPEPASSFLDSFSPGYGLSHDIEFVLPGEDPSPAIEFSDQSPNDMESCFLDLYMEHVQPLHPICERQRLRTASPRLKNAISCISSRFSATAGRAQHDRTPAYFAERAERLVMRNKQLDFDELHAQLLLCLHLLSEGLHWQAATDLAKLYQSVQIFKSQAAVLQNAKSLEELSRLWWSAYSLETCCHAMIMLPANAALWGPPPSLTCRPAPKNDESDIYPQPEDLLQSQGCQVANHESPPAWQVMLHTFRSAPSADRGLYFATCMLMRRITHLRFELRHGDKTETLGKLQNLQNELAAIKFVLPVWYFKPVRRFEEMETSTRHRERLQTTFLFLGVSLLTSISQVPAQPSLEHWMPSLAGANDVVELLRNWDPSYFAVLDPMCSAIVFCASAVLGLYRASIIGSEQRDNNRKATQQVDLVLMKLFLDKVAECWEIGKRLAESFERLETWTESFIHVHKATDILRDLIDGTLSGNDPFKMDRLAQQSGLSAYTGIKAIDDLSQLDFSFAESNLVTSCSTDMNSLETGTDWMEQLMETTPYPAT